MRRRVIAHGGLADGSVHDCVDSIADSKGWPRVQPIYDFSDLHLLSLEGAPSNAVFVGRGFYDHLVRAHALHRVIASLDFSDDSVQLIAVKRAAVPNLPTRFRIKRRVIEDDLAL